MTAGSSNPVIRFNAARDTRLVVLDNGLTIIVREDHSAPVVSAQAWARTGSIHEGEWLGAGLSHILEHMLFKGTESRGVGRIDQEVQEAGGYMNAYTSFDRTVYYIDAPNTGAKVAVDILCDIMQHATLPEMELKKELDVIRREIDMGQDDPGRRASRRLFETAYTVSPYRYTVIGYPDIFEELRREDIVGYYRSRYIPSNIFYTIVGDVDSDAVLEQISEAFSANKNKPSPARLIPSEPRQTSSREVIEQASTQLTHLHYSWHVPDLRHPDLPALDALATLLGNGRSSRLYQNVRERKGVVNSADAWTYTPAQSGLFGMSAVVDPDKFDEACTALLEELDKLKSELVNPEEVGKVVKQFVSSTLATRKTMEGQAQNLGDSWISVNDLDFSDRYLEAVKEVSPEDVRRVANDYLEPENRTLYALVPEGVTPTGIGDRVSYESGPIQKVEFSNGLKLLLKEDHRLPFVQMRAMFQGGVLAEKMVNCGVTQLMAKLLVKGTSSHTGQQIAEQIESVGGGINAYGGNNSFGVSVEIMSDDFSLGLGLMADVILNPSFPLEALERQRSVQLAAIKAQNDKLLQKTFRLMRENLFGVHGYGLDALGTEQSVTGLNKDSIISFHEQLAVPDNSVIAVFGDINASEVRAELERLFGLWRKGSSFKVPNLMYGADGIRRIANQADKEQAVAVLGYRGTTFFDPDRYALELLSEACSDLGSRLFMRIREELGLAYYVGAQSQPGLTPGSFAFYAGTSLGQLAQVEKELLAEAAKLSEKGLSVEELERAKSKMIGQRKISRQDLGGLAMASGLDELYGLGYGSSEEDEERIMELTAENVQKVAQKYLSSENYVLAVTHP
jgi:zinc protease